jgi:5-hydroxyisourate hydrolase-like protein (transthyretin family)
MRYIKDITSNRFKIGVYQWNNKYIIKIENGMYEQTYKIDQYEVENVEEIEKCIDEAFLDRVVKSFQIMGDDFHDTLLRNEVIF